MFGTNKLDRDTQDVEAPTQVDHDKQLALLAGAERRRKLSAKNRNWGNNPGTNSLLSRRRLEVACFASMHNGFKNIGRL